MSSVKIMNFVKAWHRMSVGREESAQHLMAKHKIYFERIRNCVDLKSSKKRLNQLLLRIQRNVTRDMRKLGAVIVFMQIRLSLSFHLASRKVLIYLGAAFDRLN